jgi:SAM-dependent methyltransferase
MSGMRSWLAQRLANWLQGFQNRHQLGTAAPASPTATTKASAADPSALPLLLHVGCGGAHMNSLPVTGFTSTPWREWRLDADASVHPDIEGSMTDMAAVPTGVVDAVYSSHGIEHLYWHDVPKALAEFLRVLKSDGFAVITCPDIQAAAAMIAEDRLFDTAYESAAGSITPFDILYSYRPFVEQNPQWMAHHCGFTFSTLNQVVRDAGFAATAGFRRPGGFDLWIVASKSQRPEAEMLALARAYLIPVT